MAEEMVTIVKIRGKGAGVESMTEVPKSTWENMQRDASKTGSTFTEPNDWKMIKGKADAVAEVVEIVPEKSPEEIIAEAEAVTAGTETPAKPSKKK